MPLYHCSAALYELGDQIMPGNWGRTIRGIGPSHNRFYAEYLLEKIRQLEFEAKPSRMEAVFAFESFDFAASSWRGDRPEYVYAVRINERNPTTHRGDMSWIDAMPEYRTFDGVEGCVRNYWGEAERGPDAWEIVTLSPLVVTDRVTRIPDNGTQ